MFCYKCGCELKDGAAFCHTCGEPQTQTNNKAVMVVDTPKVSGRVDERPDLFKQIENCFEAMTAIKKDEDKIIALEEEQEKYSSLRNFLGFGGIVAIVWFAAFGPIIVLAMLEASVGVPMDTKNMPLVAIGFPVVIFVLIILHIKKKNRLISEQLNMVYSELEQHKQDSSLSWLPYDYRDSTSFVYIFRYLQNMRAYNLTDAINLYETEMHQARLELISQVTAEYAREARDAAVAAGGMVAADAFFSLFF